MTWGEAQVERVILHCATLIRVLKPKLNTADFVCCEIESRLQIAESQEEFWRGMCVATGLGS